MINSIEELSDGRVLVKVKTMTFPGVPNVNGYVYSEEEYNKAINSERTKSMIRDKKLHFCLGGSHGEFFEDKYHVNEKMIEKFSMGPVVEIANDHIVAELADYARINSLKDEILNYDVRAFMVYSANISGKIVTNIEFTYFALCPAYHKITKVSDDDVKWTKLDKPIEVDSGIKINNKFTDDLVGICRDISLEEQLKANPIAALTSGKIDERFIGTVVALPNSNIDCQEWIIADVNHDNTEGTVDLFSVTTLANSAIKFSDNSQIYNGSILDKYLENTVYDGFSDDVKKALDLMDVESNGATIQRHVVAPSLREVGNNYPNYVLEEGTIYPIFSPADDPNAKSIYKTPSDGNACYWTRSRYTGGSNLVWFVDADGDAYGNYGYGDGYCVVARIRFKVK